MKIICTFSGGKDSLASLLWVRENLTTKFTTVFCDTGWESEVTYNYIKEIDKLLGLDLVYLKSKKYDGMIDLAEKRGLFPSTMRRFCTEELKIRPMIDYLLDDVAESFIVIQGIRSQESAARAKLKKQCTLFKDYREPYGVDKKGKPRVRTYRQKEVLKFIENNADEIMRPVFDWSSQQVVDYITSRGVPMNPLYTKGFKRVGCFPCIMEGLGGVGSINKYFPNRVKEIDAHEKRLGRTFFHYGKIPQRATSSKKPGILDLVKYVEQSNATGDIFKNDFSGSCVSYYGLCE